MENQELMRYLKDAIDQETAIAEQESAIAEYGRLSLLRKPKQKAEKYPRKPKVKAFSTEFRPYIAGLLGIIAFVALLVTFSWTQFDENRLVEARAEYERLLSKDPGRARYYRDDVEELEEKKLPSTIATVVMYISLAGAGVVGLTILNDKRKVSIANEQALADYQTACAEVDERNAQRDRQYQQDLSVWTRSNAQVQAYMAKPLSESRALLNRFYASEIIYPKYRTLPALTSIYEYFMTGRCTELTGPHGAYNLYEDELRKDTVISQLNTVIENLEQIRHNQYMLYQQVKAIQENTAVIASELNQIKGYTVQIAQLTALNAYYAALNERNTRITMYYHL